MASSIIGQGFGDYYRMREKAAANAADATTSNDDFQIYDDLEVQKAFVREHDGLLEAELLIEGIRCSACCWLNEQVIAQLPGVSSVMVNYATHRVLVQWDERTVRLSTILQAISIIGYKAHPYDPRRVELVHREEQRQAIGRLFVAGFGMMQIMMYAFPVYLAEAGDMTWDVEQLFRWAGMVLTAPVLFYSAAPFFQGAYRYLRVWQLGMDVPVALGLVIAFGASLYATIAGEGEVYFDSISMFVFLLLLGRYVELLARQRATRSLRHLGRIVPEFADRLLDYPASLIADRVSVAVLRIGDHVIVKTGQQVPADGVVVSGSGAVDESLLSGEARPVAKRPGDFLVGGSISVDQVLVIRITKVGAGTVLSSILRLVERAAGEKHQVALLADRMTGAFILSILVLSGIAALYWGLVDPGKALGVTLSILVATCPCAFSLATPVAMTASTGELARRGFIVTKAHAIESLARATDIVFDKTGTLTLGRVRLIDLIPAAGYSVSDCLKVASAMEAGATHPIATALREAAREEGTPDAVANNIRSVPGEGIEAQVAGTNYRLGAPAFVAPWAGLRRCESAEADRTVVILASRNGVVAEMRFGDELRSDAAQAVSELKDLGLCIHLVTGDGESVAREVAGQLGIDRIKARALPVDKHAYVEQLQSKGAVVAMIGDGVNDAPVLARSDISVAMIGGAHIAQFQASAVLVSGRLRDLSWAVIQARQTLKVIRQNIAWAFAYNLTILPLALAGVIVPWVAAVGMSTSSLLVVINALRLAHGRSPGIPDSLRWKTSAA